MFPRLFLMFLCLLAPLSAYAQGGDMEAIVNAVPNSGGMVIVAILWNIESKRRAEEAKAMLEVIKDLTKGKPTND